MESPERRFSKDFETSSLPEGEVEKRAELVIGDKYWSVLQQRMGISPADRVDKPQYLRVVFASEHPQFSEMAHAIADASELEKGNVMLVGGYLEDTESIHLNYAQEDIPEEYLAEVLSHELVHYVQDLTQKFPDAKSRRGPGELDQESPWEKEAYRLQKRLRDDFLEHCDILS